MGILPDWMVRRDVKITPFAEGVKRSNTISYGLSSYGYDARLGYKGKIFTNVWCGTIDPKNFDPKAFVEVDLTPEHEWFAGRCNNCGYNRIDHRPDSPNTLCGLSKKPNFFTIPPNSFMLGEILEEFDIPRDVLCLVVGKSTIARCGLIVNVTPGEPEWKGRWTVEISNTTPLPAKVYAGEGVMQTMFFRSDGIAEELIKSLISFHEAPNAIDTHPHALAELLRLLSYPKVGTCAISYKDKQGKYQDQTGLTMPRVDQREPI